MAVSQSRSRTESPRLPSSDDAAGLARILWGVRNGDRVEVEAARVDTIRTLVRAELGETAARRIVARNDNERPI